MKSTLIPTSVEISKVLAWLLDPSDKHRGTGRTQALAEVYIQLAAQYPGRRFTVHDHSDTPRSEDFLFRRISDMLAKGDREYQLHPNAGFTITK